MTYRPVVCVRFVWSRTCSRPDAVVVVVLLTCSAPGRPKQAGGVCTSGIVPSVHGPPHDFAFQAGVVVGSMRNSGFCLFACLVRIRA